MSDLDSLKNLFPQGFTETYLNKGQMVACVSPAHLHEALRRLKEMPEFDFNFLMDVVGVDYLGEFPRFEVVYLLYSLQHNRRLQVKVRVDEGQSLPTISDLYASADWAEREVWDMFGIRFENHPNLKRILLFDGFQGHPLRKDYPVDRRQEIPVIHEKLSDSSEAP